MRDSSIELTGSFSLKVNRELVGRGDDEVEDQKSDGGRWIGRGRGFRVLEFSFLVF